MEDAQTQTQTQTQTQEGKPFRLNAQRFLITYKTHLDKEEYTKWATKKFAKQGISFIRLAHETGDHEDDEEECPYEHTHVYIELKRRCNITGNRCLDYENIHPHCKTIPKEGSMDTKAYLAKEDPANADLLTINTPLYTKIKACATIHEALEKFVEKPSDALGIIALHQIGSDGNFRRRTRVVETPVWKPWQQEIIDMLEKTPNNRDVIWVYEPVGNTGKSWFSKNMCLLDPVKYRRAGDLGNSRDGATTIEGMLKSGWEAWGLFINLARQTENHERMYRYIEDIKDGCVTTQKYQGRALEFDEPHVVVFANWPPMTWFNGHETISIDRWKIFEIINDDHLVKVDQYKLRMEQIEKFRGGVEVDGNTQPSWAGLV